MPPNSSFEGCHEVYQMRHVYNACGLQCVLHALLVERLWTLLMKLLSDMFLYPVSILTFNYTVLELYHVSLDLIIFYLSFVSREYSGAIDHARTHSFVYLLCH